MEISDPISSVLANKSPKLWTANPEDTVFHTIEKMSKRNVGALPVVKDSALIGIISERDYAREVILKGRSSKKTLVGEIMSEEVVTAAPTSSVQSSLELMTQHRICHLPVVNDTEVVGVISIGDLVKDVIAIQQTTIEQLENYIRM